MKTVIYTLLIPALLTLGACVSYDKFDTNTVEGSYGLGKALADDDRYEEALLQFRDVKNKFPYSRYATEAELQIGEVQFKKESYQEAQSAYTLFKELHPKHEKIDYVTFKIGESLYKQLPSTDDRDLMLAPQAIRLYRAMIQNYPQSSHVEEAQKRIQEITNRLASKELYIADFYFRTEVFLSALSRYEKFIAEFPKHPKQAHARYRAGISAANIDNLDKKSSLLRGLIEAFPQSPEAEKAKEAL